MPPTLKNFQLTDKTELYTVINYLSQLLPTSQQIETLKNQSPENPEFYIALKQVHKNVNFAQQTKQEQVFEYLILIYNYALQKVL